ncbi:cortical protein marker for cell polarity-domain-containing protein [Syncephalis plumigaleata]|nr:cortical protein marker for cell polarity-domain-containing protein [Syncephalis plumigaleata]
MSVRLLPAVDRRPSERDAESVHPFMKERRNNNSNGNGSSGSSYDSIPGTSMAYRRSTYSTAVVASPLCNMSKYALFNSLFLVILVVISVLIGNTAATATTTTTSTASSSETKTHPPLSVLDVKQIGSLGLVGNFDGLSLRSEPADTPVISLPSSMVVANNQTLPATLVRRAGASLEILGQTSSNGTINAICILSRSDNGSLELGVDIFVGGRFSSIGGVKSNNIARYDPVERKFHSLAQGLDGPVRSLLCDEKRQILYVGGRFRAPVPEKTPDTDPEADPFASWGQFGGGIAKWQNKQWKALPFKGVAHNITANSQSNGDDDDASNARYGVNALALSADGQTVIVGGGFSGTADSSSYLTPNSQPINLGAALVSAGATSPESGQNDPRNIVCSADGQAPSNERAWLMQDNAPGYWRAQLPMTATISLLKIKNAQVANRGVKTFSVNSLPDNGLLTLSYFDTDLGRTLVCREKSENQIEGRGINMNVIEWYGLGGGLASMELFQRDILTYADNRFNFPACAKTPVRSEATLTGTWSALQLPSVPRTVMQYTYTGTSTGAITFNPNVPEDGFYEVYLLQPGCDLDQSCDRRNLVDVTVTAAPQAAAVTTTVDQSIRGNRRVLLYTGLVAGSAGSDGFSPKITLRIGKSARALANGVTGSIVADAIQFVRLQTISQLNGVLLVSNTGDTGITWNALNEQLPSGAIVNALQPTSSGSLFIGGQFRDSARNYTNIVEYTSNTTLQSLPDSGVNGIVNALADTGETLWVGGGFTHTERNATVLLNLASFSYRTREWQSDLQVDGPVTLLDGDVNRQQVFVSGTFHSVYSNNSAPQGNGNQSVIQSSASYLDMDGIAVSYIGGSNRLTALEAIQTTGALVVDPRIGASITSNVPGTFATSGVFYKSPNGSTAMAITGQLPIASERRIAMWEQGRWRSLLTNTAGTSTGAGAGAGANLSTSNITSIEVLDRTMLFGSTNGVSYYALDQNNTNGSPVPIANGPSGLINRLIKKSDQSMLVGGSFAATQQLACQHLCQFNLNDQSWHKLGNGISDAVVDMALIAPSQDVVVATDKQTISIYNNNDDEWYQLGSSHDTLPGPITSITVDGSTERVIIAGQQSDSQAYYLVRWIEDRYESFGEGLIMDQSVISQLAMVPITTSMSDSRELSPNFALLVVGQLYIKGLNDDDGSDDTRGNTASPLNAALFDGKVWRPYLHTSATTIINNSTSTSSIQRVFFEIPPLPSGPHFMAIPLVILISAAISLGLISLIVLIALLVMMLRRHWRLKQEPLPPTAREVTASIHPGEHQSFADGVMMLPGTTSTPPFGRSLTDLHQMNADESQLPPVSPRALTSAVMADDLLFDTANYMAVYARYPFSATEPGELEFRAGDKIYVLDNSDDIWWMGMVDNGPGVPPSQGVFPASYASETPPDPSPWNFF